MLKREDFVFCIGYQGDAAIVDGRLKKSYRSLGTAELLEKGLFRAAFSSAIYSEDEQEIMMVINTWNEMTGASMKSPEEMKRLLGIFSVPADISKVITL